MPKPTKRAPKRAESRTETPKATAEAVLDLSITTLYAGLLFLRAELDKIAKGTAAKSKHDAASRVAFLSQRVGSIADSIRKVEAARAKRLEDITAADVLAFLRQLEPDERSRFIREVQAIDAGGSGLA